MGAYGGYIRVSVVGDRDGERFISPSLQRDRITGWAAAHGHGLADIREDLDVSGGSRKRPQLEALIGQIEAGQLDGLVVAKLDRFARNLVHGITLIERIDKAGGQFVAVADGFDTSTPYGRLALNIMLSIGQFELERYRDQARDARAAQVQAGRWTGSRVPFGYAKQPDGRLVPGEHAALARELFERRAAGESLTVLARWLDSLGIRTGRDGTPRRQWARDVIASRAYLGEVRAGAAVNREAHEPLVDELLWQRAQQARSAVPARSAGEARALAGILRCDGCRYALSPAKARYAGGAKTAYRCRGRHAAGECPAPAFCLEDQILPMVERAFFWLVGGMHADAAGDAERAQEAITERDHARAELVAYRDTASAVLSPGDFADGLRVRQAAVDDAERQLAAQVAARPAGLPDATSLRFAWPSLTVSRKRRMFAAAFDAVAVAKPLVPGSHSEPLPGRAWFAAAGTLDGLPRPGASLGALHGFGLRGADDPPDGWVSFRQVLEEDGLDGIPG